MKRVILFEENRYTEYPLVEQLEVEGISLCVSDKKIYYINEQGKEEIAIQKRYTKNEKTFLILSEQEIEYEKESTEIFIGQEFAEIEVAQGKYIIEGNTLLSDEEQQLYINGQLMEEKEVSFTYGDQILLAGDILLVIHQKTIIIIANKETYHCHLPYIEKGIYITESFPEYKRSPRIIKRLKEEKITISKPPSKANRKKNSLVKVIVPPVVMAAGTVAMSFTMGKGITMLIGLAGTAVSLVFSITSYFADNKELEEINTKREKIYENYLLGIRKKLSALKKDEIEALHYNHPSLIEIEEMVNQYNPRIYERDVNDDDFLTLTVGSTEDVSTYAVSLDYDALETEKDELLDEAKEIYQEYLTIKEKPISIDLKKAHFGIVGEKHEVHEQLKWYFVQLTFFQSYHDVQIVMLYNEEFKEELDYIKWYPHNKIQAINLTGNINTERIRDQVLGSLHQILKDRKLKRDENKKEMNFVPHFVIIVDDPHLVMNHAVMEYLQEATTELGFSLIYTAQKRANLPENIRTVLVMEDMNTATLLLNEGIEISKRLEQERINDVDLETMARNISVLNHVQGVSSHIPEAITFFDMYKVTCPEELQIQQRWEMGQSHKSLSVPLGLRAVDDVVELNLHEKAHGPHGLVAGTTGSGKSEIIQSYILSLAVNFSPYEVGFLLIDYKGGGMANLFTKMPHLLGTITNLDGAESMRALASIKAELSRRQRIFNDNNVNNINKYNQLFKSGKAEEPLPHLFLISDEFAELKKEQPDFMSELVSVARIGRTLGVHLILATQKPTGVVDDQIWSNSKFKLALKVQDEGDSREIIKTSDAAFITLAGRAYLQVGNNEIYELFQSAWSGALYADEKTEKKADNRIYRVNLLGQGELINQDLSDKIQTETNMTTQLDAVVDYIDDLYQKQETKEIKKPWLPSLSTNIKSPYIETIQDTNKIHKVDLECRIGLVDIPEEQKQEDYAVDFVKEGNLAVFSSSGYGKSTTIGTILLSLAVKNNPQLMNYYILDFGNSSLIPYKMLPHTADYLTFDSEEKLQKFQRIIMDEIKERKRIFAQEMVQNFDMYNKMHEDTPLKAIFIIIDNYDVVREISMDFEDFIMKTTRDGVGLGIYTIITATRSNAVRFATLNNFKNKIVQYLFDEGDVSSLIGRSPYKLSEIKGRALIKQKIISMMQVYAPVAFEDDVQFITNLKEVVQSVQTQYTGEKIIGIPVLPDVFTTRDFSDYKCESENTNLIGLSLDKVESISLTNYSSPYIVLGPAKSGKTNFLEMLINQSVGRTYIFDSDNMDLFKYQKDDKKIYVNTEDSIRDFLEDLYDETENRKEGLTVAMSSQEQLTPKQYYESLPVWSIFIDDVDVFVAKVQNIPNIENVLENAINTGIHIVATVASTKLKGFDGTTKIFKNATSGIVLGQMGSINIFPLNMREIPTFGYGVLCDNGETRKIRLPKYVAE